MKDKTDKDGKVIAKAEIITEVIGKHRYIDWNKYKDVVFDEKAVNRLKKSA